MLCARQRRNGTHISISKFLGAIHSQTYKFYAIIYKSNSKNTLCYCYHTALKMGAAGSSETSIMSTIHYAVSKYRIPKPKSMYGCIIAGKFDFLFQAVCNSSRLCRSNTSAVTDKPTHDSLFLREYGRKRVCQFLFTWLYAQNDGIK